MANLRIEPSDNEIQFYLQDEMPECSVTLNQVDQLGPLIYRIQPTQRQRYAIWPSVGVVQPGNSVIVSVVLLERARLGLEKQFEEVGPIAEFRQMDAIVVEWCRAPEAVYRRLKGDDSEKDIETLHSFWNTKGYEFSTPVVSARQPIRVRFSMSDPPASLATEHEHEHEHDNDNDNHTNNNTSMLPSVSLDESTNPELDPSITCDDSLMLSISTWEDDSRREVPAVRWQDDRAGYFPKRPSHVTHQQQQQQQQQQGTTAPSAPSSTRAASSYYFTTPDATTTVSSKSAIHKFQLQQTLRCGGCYEVFSRDPNELTIPVMSQACGHTICRGCVVRKADEHYAFTQTYQNTVSCPLCNVPRAFSLELHINHSLCAVIALIDA